MNSFTKLGSMAIACAISIAPLITGSVMALPAQIWSSVEEPFCLQWNEFKQILEKHDRTDKSEPPMLRFQSLPLGFKQGCILFDRGNTIRTAYVLKDGEVMDRTTRIQDYDRLVQIGQAIVITWIVPSNGTLDYFRSMPRDRAFVRKDGKVCFETVCLFSKVNSKQELIRILEAGKSSKSIL